MPFERNVFINCPFDEDYLPLLKPLLFTVLYVGLDRCISETADGAAVRVERVKRFIGASMYSIHDLSRSDPPDNGEFPRFNMPYELGLDIGCKTYGSRRQQTKICLILESIRYQYRRVLSDIGGQDTSSHEGDPEKLVRAVRNWFVKVWDEEADAPARIWEAYNEFNYNWYSNLIRDGYSEQDIADLPYSEIIRTVKRWLISYRRQG